MLYSLTGYVDAYDSSRVDETTAMNLSNALNLIEQLAYARQVATNGRVQPREARMWAAQQAIPIFAEKGFPDHIVVYPPYPPFPLTPYDVAPDCLIGINCGSFTWPPIISFGS